MHTLIVSSAQCRAILPFTVDGLRRHFGSKDIVVVCPSRDRAILSPTISGVTFYSDEDLISSGCLDQIRAIPSLQKSSRAGWYIQQFLKMQYAKTCAEADYLIWDADTVPLRPVRFKDEKRYLLVPGTEHHQPYFDTLQRLLGLARVSRQSFIAQGMPVRCEWMRALMEEIERRHSRPWIDAILLSLKGPGTSLFSEYETYGTYVFERYSSQAAFHNDIRWFRYGRALLGSPARLNEYRFVARLYHFVAFEEWDTGVLRRARALVKVVFDGVTSRS